MRRHVRWAGWDGQGLDHCDVTLSADGLTLDGVVVGNREGAYGAHYRVQTDAAGRTRGGTSTGGVGGTPIPGWLCFLCPAVLVVPALFAAFRRKKGGTPQTPQQVAYGPDGRPLAPEQVEPLESLQRRAAAALVGLDDAVRQITAE